MRQRLSWSKLVLLLAVLLALVFSTLWRRLKSVKSEARIAYFLQVSSTNVQLLPRLLNALYDPTNYYAIHLDLKIPENEANSALLNMYRSLANEWGVDNAFNIPNIVVLRSEVITYRGSTMTMNYLTGINRLLAEGEWEYFVNLSGADYPTASQDIIRRLLGSVLARNFVEWKPHGTWYGFAEKRLGEFYIDTGLGKLYSAESIYIDASGEEISHQTRGAHHLTNPLLSHLDYTVAKTSGWFILSREFCEHLRGDSDARKIMMALSFSDASDEHIFGTVLWNAGVRWRESVVPGNMRTIFFVAPNGSFPIGADGVRSRQHPFWVDEVDEDQRLLFWEELKRMPRFFTRKVRDGGTFRDKVDREMIGVGRLDSDDLRNLHQYESTLERQFQDLIQTADSRKHQDTWPSEERAY